MINTIQFHTELCNIVQHCYISILTRISLEDEVRSPLDGGEERRRPHGWSDVIAVVPEVEGEGVVHLDQVGGVEVAAAGGSEKELDILIITLLLT